MNEITLQNQQTLWRLLACHREWHADILDALLNTVFLLKETQGHIQCPITCLTPVIIGCMV